MNVEKPLLDAWYKKDWGRLLIGLLIVVAIILARQYLFKDQRGYSDNKEAAQKVEQLLREREALIVKMQKAIDSTANAERAKTDAVTAEFSKFKEKQFAEMEERLARAERGDKRFNRLVRTFTQESNETKKTSRQLDSASKKLDL